MKNKNNKSITIVVLLAVLVTLSLLLFGCPDGMADNYSVTFEGAAQIGGESTIATSTGLTLSFDVDPTSLAASDITVTGATKGELSDSGATRTLTISGITVGNGETVSVAIASPTGFTISGSPQTATVYKDTRTAVTFQSAVQTGGTSGTADSTGLTLSFDVDPTSLAASDITVTGATKGTLSGSGPTRTLAISGITVGNGGTVSVAIASPTGFVISGSPQTAVVYNEYAVGDLGPSGGHIFYDKGSVSDGWRYLEAAPASLEWSSKVWGGYGTVVGGTGLVIGTGASNTEKIVAKFGDVEPYAGKTDYAAKLCTDLEVTNGGATYDDWFLPSKDELNLMYQNLKNEGIGGFSDENYWSSSEYNANYAWGQYFASGNQRYYTRSANGRVRPVRAF